jgi:hypothetical protein
MTEILLIVGAFLLGGACGALAVYVGLGKKAEEKIDEL